MPSVNNFERHPGEAPTKLTDDAAQKHCIAKAKANENEVAFIPNRHLVKGQKGRNCDNIDLDHISYYYYYYYF